MLGRSVLFSGRQGSSNGSPSLGEKRSAAYRGGASLSRLVPRPRQPPHANPVAARRSGGRFCGVDQWPDLRCPPRVRTTLRLDLGSTRNERRVRRDHVDGVARDCRRKAPRPQSAFRAGRCTARGVICSERSSFRSSSLGFANTPQYLASTCRPNRRTSRHI